MQRKKIDSSNRTKVFISWSGSLSNLIANALREWLPTVIQSTAPWMSDRDIYAGQRWPDELARELAETEIGLVCLTKDNRMQPWLHFEAGALSKAVRTGIIIPILFEIEDTDVVGPLSQFQAARLDQNRLFRVVESIYERLENPPVNFDTVQKTFKAFWPELKQALDKIKNHSAKPTDTSSEKTSDRELLVETLRRVREIERKAEPQIRPGPSASGNDAAKVVVHWYTDLVAASEALLSDLSFREYQLELRRQQETSIYRQIQAEWSLTQDAVGKLRRLQARTTEPSDESWASTKNAWSAWVDVTHSVVDTINVNVSIFGS